MNVKHNAKHNYRVPYKSYLRNYLVHTKFLDCLENLDLDSYYSTT